MGSPDMSVQDQFDGSGSNNSVISASNGISFCAAGVELKDQFSTENDYAPKARKPYTITKQRERWTEEEHMKFLEALKLYGRAWRKIEEHVGTKTAVQIRSHAQKFFSKVARDPNVSNPSSAEPISIPPPRPKRKPMRPYPRKLAVPLPKESSVVVEQSSMSQSPKFSVSEIENQSPTSVLSVIGSDTLGSTDSNIPSGSLSPVSSAAGDLDGDLIASDSNAFLEESGSTSPAVAENGSLPNQQLSLKLELFPTDNAYADGGSAEEASARRLKLFGRTVLVTDSHRPSSHNVGTSKSLSSDIQEEKPAQTSKPCNLTVVDSSTGSGEHVWDNFPHGGHQGICYMQYENQKLNPAESGAAYPSPWWTLFPELPYPFIPFNKQQPMKEHVDCNLGDPNDRQVEREGSSTGSDAGSASDEESRDRQVDIETQGGRHVFDKNQEPNSVFQFRASANSAFSKLRPRPGKCTKGFIPYKRSAESDDNSSTIASEEREGKRVHLFL